MGVAPASDRQTELHHYGTERPDGAEGRGRCGVPAQGRASGLRKPESTSEQRFDEPEGNGSVRAKRLRTSENSARYGRKARERRAHFGTDRAEIASDGG